MEACFIHYAIHKLHWPPSLVFEWLGSPRSVKAFYLGSTLLKIEKDKTE